MEQENENTGKEDDTDSIGYEYEGLVGCVRKLYETMPAFKDYTPPRRRENISR